MMAKELDRIRKTAIAFFVLFLVWQVSHTWAHGWNMTADRYSTEWWQDMVGVVLLIAAFISFAKASGYRQCMRANKESPHA